MTQISKYEMRTAKKNWRLRFQPLITHKQIIITVTITLWHNGHPKANQKGITEKSVCSNSRRHVGGIKRHVLWSTYRVLVRKPLEKYPLTKTWRWKGNCTVHLQKTSYKDEQVMKVAHDLSTGGLWPHAYITNICSTTTLHQCIKAVRVKALLDLHFYMLQQQDPHGVALRHMRPCQRQIPLQAVTIQQYTSASYVLHFL
jgi:hypothetical protein